ncbi:MAG: hypothetical protein JWQ21_719 [Herminiimonas sp.]|jgi:hypothetical protein|nr:hypothetical protein [Herminiimonas sp.]
MKELSIIIIVGLLAGCSSMGMSGSSGTNGSDSSNSSHRDPTTDPNSIYNGGN